MSNNQQKKNKQLPDCTNKREAKLVCLNSTCDQYPFFCTQCPNDQCQIIHHHGSKLQSVSFKQYIKRVLKQKKIDQNLEKALKSYQQCLIKLEKDIKQFVEVELKDIQQIRRKATEIDPKDQQIIIKLKKYEYQSLKGMQLDRVWQNTISQQSDNKTLKQTIQFLNVKQQQVRQISQNFESVNKMQMGQDEDSDKKSEKQDNVDKEGNQQVQKPVQDDNQIKK